MKFLAYLALLPFVAWVLWSVRLDTSEIENDSIAMVVIIGKIVGVFVTIGGLVYGVVWGGGQLGWW